MERIKLKDRELPQYTKGEEIANMVKENPQKATELVDTKVFEALNNIIKYDSSSLEGPSQAQIDARQKIMENKQVTNEENKLANTMAPKELAERVPTAGLFEGQTDEKEMGVTYKELDDFLLGKEIRPEAVARIEYLHRISEHKRSEVPSPSKFIRD